MTTPDCYRILVNNWDFVRFNHRIPPSEVRYLQLTDGAEYYETLVQNNCVSSCSFADGWGRVRIVAVSYTHLTLPTRR